MVRVGKWKRLEKTFERTVWINTISNEKISVERYYPMGREVMMFISEYKDPSKNWWESSVASGLVSSRKEAESDAVAYMRDFPEGEKTYYARFGR